MGPDPLLQGVVQGFVVEAQELSESVTRHLLEAERAEESGALVSSFDEIARALHTLKGSAATLGLDDIATLAHAMEDAVAPFRAAKRRLPSEAVDALLQSLDAFLVRLRQHAEGSAAAMAPVDGLLARLGALAAGDVVAKIESAPGSPAADLGGAEEEPVDGASTWRVATRQVVALMRDVERLRESALRLSERRRDVDKVLGALNQRRGPEHREIGALVAELRRAIAADAEDVGDIVDALEDGVNAISTQPVRTILDPLHRTVRDLARAAGKEAKLSVVGGEISLDRRVLGALKTALVHLLRNAVDHGIEPPDVREARGKHREGAMVVRVEKQGNLVMIDVSDDGGGIPTARVREIAAARMLDSPEALARMDAKQIDQLVFLPGLSTRHEVTEMSGRGVGLDAVRSHIETLQGHIDVQSVVGEGARFVIALPTDLGSSPVLVVAAADQQFALPIVAVETIVAARRDKIRAGRAPVMEHGDQLVRLADLASLLGLRHPGSPYEDQPVLVLNAGGNRLAVAVDEVLGHWDLVIRALPAEVKEIVAYQGASILFSGKPIMILRPEWLVRVAPEAEGKPTVPAKLALVVDDALTARALHRAMLEAGGYGVHTVSSAQQALDRLRTSTYDVLVCDVSMEGMDGFALTSMLRTKRDTRSLPIVLVSAHESDADRARGLSAGADAFLTKRECGAGRLLAAVGDAIARHRPSP